MRHHILSTLERAGHGMTPIKLLSQAPSNCFFSGLIPTLEALELERKVILHRDSSAGMRVSGGQYSGITLVCLRKAV